MLADLAEPLSPPSPPVRWTAITVSGWIATAKRSIGGSGGGLSHRDEAIAHAADRRGDEVLRDRPVEPSRSVEQEEPPQKLH